jgi:hypothetical protein
MSTPSSSWRRLALLVVLAALATGCGAGGKPSRLVVGAVEDAAKSGNTQAEMQRTAESGFRAVAFSSIWTRGLQAPAPGELAALLTATDAAAAHHIRPIVDLYQFSAQTPITPTDQVDFAAYAAALINALPKVHYLIVGNEPNLNLFWMPQFDVSGADVAATSFESLLAQTYDAVKAVRPNVQVIGAGLSPRGSDKPSSLRPTHSPTQFLLDLGAAYRASHRDRPIMDALSIHPYGENPRIPPTLRHPRTASIGIADYDKLVALLGSAFDGTAQAGRRLPIVYGEYGVETTIPPAKAALYTGHEVVATVDESTQSDYYTTAISLAACQPTVELLLFFHVEDESDLRGLQSGVRYADGTPKSSESAVAKAAADVRCNG